MKRETRKRGAVAIHDDKPNNVLREVHAEFGDSAAGFANADPHADRPGNCDRRVGLSHNRRSAGAD